MMMRAILAVMVAVAAAFSASPSLLAQGLLYQLPDDGVWARFEIQGEAKEGDVTKATLSGTLTISSVGSVEVDGKKCRWIEIVCEGRVDDKAFTDIDKLLLLEEQLTEGKEPLQGVIKVWHKHSQVPGGPKQIEDLEGRGGRYLDKLRPYLHGPFETAEKLESTIVDSKLGKLECDGTTANERTKSGEILTDATYTIRRHKNAPFGVVSWEARANLERDIRPLGTMITKLKLIDFGRDAKSGIPESK